MSRGRPLSKVERAWLERALRTLEDHGTAVAQLDELRVVSTCCCGEPTCCTVQFQYFEPGCTCLLATASTDDGRTIIVTAHERTGELTELEVI
jgi:hypothetical protein